jgi:hypothetical protein
MEPNRRTTEGQVTGIIGIVLGVISLIVAFIPCVGVVAFLPGGLAIIFSIISIVQATRGNGSKGLGIVSLVVSSLAILLAVAWLMLFSGVSLIANEAINDPEKFEILEKGIKDALKGDLDDDSNKPRIDSLENQLRKLEDESLDDQPKDQPEDNQPDE